ncbi:hypothetical protein GCG21_11995 [Pseudactinotalea sp. HY160]|uniref:SGNH hydrolase domain-containing protein n=1 Tax=Pseudactinotalea sp. HY160 TaxID=2654490 RepID=UPI00128E34FC|nr:SGNH hydrolase domain-containing protein [Pseudactinotalea sp. HY160]MPV50714.1 hypothetical protein [Pseudactinotalea sp. HY160]
MRPRVLRFSLAVNLALAATAASMIVLLLLRPVPETASAVDGGPPGAGALIDPEGTASTPGGLTVLGEPAWFLPAPQDAPDDVPAAYADGCQQGPGGSDPAACVWGLEDGTPTIAVVGDSKLVQWQSALSAVAERHGWRILAYTKSACGFHAGMQVRDGEPYASCADWNDRVLAELDDVRPAVVLTSQGAAQALADDADPDSGSSEAMVDALAQRWATLEADGMPVVALLDNPHPPGSVFPCVADHPDDLAACSFDRGAGIDRSAAPAQRLAARRVPGVELVDLTEFICPTVDCVPVIGHVLVYRQGSHLTDTYVRTLTDALDRRLAPLVQGVRHSGG